MNFTIEVPDGATNHNDPDVLCLPPEWTDYIALFYANYLAHAATLYSAPGASLTETLIATVTAFFVTGFGILKVIKRIFLHSATVRNDDLRRVARSGALVAVWITDKKSATAVIVSLAQGIWATVTLYRARGTQIDTYGYAAFGLSAAPYTVMSLVNLTAGVLTPEYQSMYLVYTPDLDSARGRRRVRRDRGFGRHGPRRARRAPRTDVDVPVARRGPRGPHLLADRHRRRPVRVPGER
ncbi:hypothetical protein PG988_001796 [Apiospora saccharicola]